MEVILLERISRLGQMGETVKVKDGFARNFLLPQGKALRANEANKKKFEGQRAQLEARNLERKTEAQAIADKLDGKTFVAVRSAGETGQLYGSVSTRDIADLIDHDIGHAKSLSRQHDGSGILDNGIRYFRIADHDRIGGTGKFQHGCLVHDHVNARIGLRPPGQDGREHECDHCCMPTETSLAVVSNHGSALRKSLDERCR